MRVCVGKRGGGGGGGYRSLITKDLQAFISQFILYNFHSFNFNAQNAYSFFTSINCTGYHCGFPKIHKHKYLNTSLTQYSQEKNDCDVFKIKLKLLRMTEWITLSKNTCSKYGHNYHSIPPPPPSYRTKSIFCSIVLRVNSII